MTNWNLMKRDAIWMGDVGIVQVIDEFPPYRKYYIGAINSHYIKVKIPDRTYSEVIDDDTSIIRKYGHRFPKEAGDFIFMKEYGSLPINPKEKYKTEIVMDPYEPEPLSVKQKHGQLLQNLKGSLVKLWSLGKEAKVYTEDSQKEELIEYISDIVNYNCK